jgi:long-chain-fatty-acyl-CoA reductase
MNDPTIALPVLVAGERRWPSENAHFFKYGDRLEVSLCRLSPEDAFMMANSGQELHRLSVDDVTVFFDQVRRNWMSEENEWRRKAIELATLSTGYARAIVESDVNYLGHTLERAKQYDFIETDLGDPALLDEWRPYKAVMQRCLPKGLVTHIMVGNVPLASLFSLYRSLVTKNRTVAKVPSRDVITALCFANCIYETDPGHPVTRALSVGYWEAGTLVEDILLGESDLVCTWGREASVAAVRRSVGPHTEVLQFGPKRSFAVILEGLEEPAAIDDMALRVAYDAAFYDQEACFSPQAVYATGDVDAFARRLGYWLDRVEGIAPRRDLGIDGDAHVHRARLECEAQDWEVIAPTDTSWTVVVTEGAQPVDTHPLGRFVFVHPIAHLEEVLGQIDRNVQTVSVAVCGDLGPIASRLVEAGADRVVPLGRMTRFRPGLTHDGLQPMRHMVRWVTLERDIRYKFRFTAVDPDTYEGMLYGPIRDAAREYDHAST